MGLTDNLANAGLQGRLGDLQRRLTDVQTGMGIGNGNLRALLEEQRRANDLAEQQLAATQQTNEHLTFLIRGFLAAGSIART
jgi:hypothetical protein